MAQMPALIPKEVEIQRLKKIYMMVIMLGSIAASVEVDNFVDGSLHQTTIRDSAFTPSHWWLYSHFIALPLGWGFSLCSQSVRTFGRIGSRNSSKEPLCCRNVQISIGRKTLQ
jgi:hypothetical protein